MKNLKERYDAVVVGAGIAGLVCANFLAKGGMKVLIIEKEARPGGYCVSFERGGFLFDICRNFGGFNEQGIMRLISSQLGIYERLDIKRSNPSDIIIIGDKRITVFNDTSKTKRSFQDAFPKEAKNIGSFFDFLARLNAVQIAEEYSKGTFKDILDRFFADEETKNAFCPLLGNVGLGPSQLSAVKGLLLYNQFILDGGYSIKGGNGKFSDMLLENLKRNGGDALLNTTVKAVKINGRKAEGVITDADDLIASGSVISACDATKTFMDMVDPSYLDKNFIKRLNAMVPSMSVFMVFLGIRDFRPAGLCDGATIWYNPDPYSPGHNFDTAYKEIYEGKIDMEHCHIVIVPSFSNNENMTLELYLGLPYMNDVFWKEKKEELSENMIKRAEKFLPGFSERIVVKETASPHTFYRHTLNRAGAMYGWASVPEQVAVSVMPPRTPIENLFLCGHWTTTGFGQGGLMSVAYTGMKLAEHILEQRRH